MRVWITAVVLTGVASWAGATAKPARPIQKIAIVALARDAARAADVEAGVKQALGAQGIPADGLRTLFSTTPATVPDILERLKAEHYDTLLCMAPRKTIRITPSDKTSKVSDLDMCLTTFVTGKSPSGEPLDINPVAEDPFMEGKGTQNTSRTPIPTNSAAVPYRISKGTLRVFDLNSEKLRWHANIHVKLPRDIQTNLETKLIVKEIGDALEKSGLWPKP